MGLFKSSTPTPKPNLALQLASPKDQVFKPNDTVYGQVTLTTPIILQPQAIEVSLCGHSAVWLRTSHRHNNNTSYTHYRDNVPLFAVTQNLFSNPQPLNPGEEYTFPFSFRVPEGTGTSRLGGYKNDADERWTVHPHALPPTFIWGHRATFSSSIEPEWDNLPPNSASVAYAVTVRLICPDMPVEKTFSMRLGLTGDPGPLSCTAPILFQPPNIHANAPIGMIRHPKAFTLASSSLSGKDLSSIGFRQKLADRFSSDTPKLDFESAIELPNLLTSGSEFQFRSSFSVLTKSENVVHIPAITFKVLKLDLLDFTFVRAARDYGANSMMSGHHFREPEDLPTGAFSGYEKVDFDEKKTALNSIPDAKTLELEEVMVPGEKKGVGQAGSAEVWFSSRVPGFTPPSFRSFAISRLYRLRVKMEIQIGEKKFEHQVESYVQSLGGAPN